MDSLEILNMIKLYAIYTTNENHQTKQTFQRESGDNRTACENRHSGSQCAVKTGDCNQDINYTEGEMEAKK